MSISHQLHEAVFSCDYCGSHNHTFIDPTHGSHQTYTEDCQTCCWPHELTIYHEPAMDEWQISSRLE